MAAASSATWRRPRVVPVSVCAQCGIPFDHVRNAGAWACRTHLAELVVPDDREAPAYFPCCGLRPLARGVAVATGMVWQPSPDEALGCCRADHAAERWDAARLAAAREGGVLVRQYKNAPPRESRAIRRTVARFADLVDVVRTRYPPTADLIKVLDPAARSMNEAMWLDALVDADFYLAPEQYRAPLLGRDEVQLALVARVNTLLTSLTNPATLPPAMARVAMQHAAALGAINPLRAFVDYARAYPPRHNNEADIHAFYTRYVSVLDWLEQTFAGVTLPGDAGSMVRQLARDFFKRHVEAGGVASPAVIACWQVRQVDELVPSALAVSHHAARAAVFEHIWVGGVHWL